MTIFEQRILCHELPNYFSSITIHNNQEQCANKRNKMVQDLKREILDVELVAFESEIYKTKHSYQMVHLNELMHYITIITQNY